MQIITFIFIGLSAIFGFLTLAAIGRLLKEFNEAQSCFALVHNYQNSKLTELAESVESALDSLLTLDAQAIHNSQTEVYERPR